MKERTDGRIKCMHVHIKMPQQELAAERLGQLWLREQPTTLEDGSQSRVRHLG